MHTITAVRRESYFALQRSVLLQGRTHTFMAGHKPACHAYGEHQAKNKTLAAPPDGRQPLQHDLQVKPCRVQKARYQVCSQEKLTRMHAAIRTELYSTKLSSRAPSSGTACLGSGCNAHAKPQLSLCKGMLPSHIRLINSCRCKPGRMRSHS